MRIRGTVTEYSATYVLNSEINAINTTQYNTIFVYLQRCHLHLGTPKGGFVIDAWTYFSLVDRRGI